VILPSRTNSRIWKFPIAITDAQVVSMPFNAEVISVQFQRGDLVLWAKGCSGDQVQLPRVFCIYGTGHPMFDVDRDYVGTVQDGGLVWHVFEVSPRSAPLFQLDVDGVHSPSVADESDRTRKGLGLCPKCNGNMIGIGASDPEQWAEFARDTCELLIYCAGPFVVAYLSIQLINFAEWLGSVKF
jgi:hypothetical protein